MCAFPAGAVPSSLLRTVDAFWRVEARGGAGRVLPDGCLDFLFDLRNARAVVVGPMTRAEVVHLSPGARLFGVRFRPGAGALFLDARADELGDRDAPLEEVVKAETAQLTDEVFEAANDADRIAAVARFLTQANARQRAEDSRVRQAVSTLCRSHGIASVRDVAMAVRLSERQLERLFLERVGLRPKLFARVMRLQRAVALETRTVTGSQAELALRAGYADESHLLRDFRALAGLAPRALAEERRVGSVQDGSAQPEQSLAQEP
jgi:AraC-like DNA-binding protein